ncbi:MAG: hypothetical protein LBI14_10215 [Treponema sp.]|jgi:hypothetical protein|nr:hypothetical protein [Treponema sp.]
MEFSFEPGRDLLYLAFLFFGAALGSFLNRFRRKCNKNFRDRSITIAILFFTGTVASLAVMLILTEATIIAYPAMFITGAVFALFALLSIRFPMTAGFSFILLAGIGIVWVSYSFLRYPKIDNQSTPLGYIAAGQREFSIEFIPDKEKLSLPIPESYKLELRITHIEYAKFFPLVGGESRGRISAIRDKETLIYEYPYFNKGALSRWNSLPFISIETVSIGFPIDPLQPNRVYSIFNNLN